MTGRGFYIATAHRLATYMEQELSVKRGHHFRFVRVMPSYKVITLSLAINPAFSRKVIGMSKELSQAACLERGSFIRIVWGGEGTLDLEVPLPQDLWKAPLTTRLPRFTGVKTAVGLGTTNQAAFTDFANPITAHGLVAGLSGSGKTNLLRILAYQLARQNDPESVKFLLFDQTDNGLAWDGFEALPHLLHDGIITDEPTALSAMDWLRGEMMRRSEVRTTTPRLFAFVDEIQELAQEKKFVEPTELLARRGRKWGINLVLATQRPTKDSLGSMNIKANLSVRIVGKVTSPQEAFWASDIPESGAEMLLGPGDMLLVKPGTMQRMSIPWLSNDDLSRLPRNGHEPKVGFEPAEDEEGGVGRPQDPLEARPLALALCDPDVSQREICRQFSIGFNKARRILELATELRREMHAQDFCVVQRSWILRRLENGRLPAM